MIALLVGVAITAATVDSVERVGAWLGALVVGLAAIGFLFKRAARFVRIVEALADLPEKLADLTASVDGLKDADEAQAQDHAEVKGAIAAVDEKVKEIGRLGKLNHERLTGIARDLGVEFRDPPRP